MTVVSPRAVSAGSLFSGPARYVASTPWGPWQALGTIDHVKVLRWHTRVPVVDPDRVTGELVDALKASSKTVYIGLHTNHERELTAPARAAIADRKSVV